MGHHRRKHSQETLRLKFWEVAPSSARASAITPFTAMRMSRDLRVGDVAARMGWETSDYTELEYGDNHASAETILAFCRALDCHPLDLYRPEAGPETPLPREILYSLVAMVKYPGFSDPARVRSLLRLDLENLRATTMVVNNRKDLRPLLTAMGYSPDYRTCSAPLYDTSRDADEVDARGMIEMSLLESQMVLERDLDGHEITHAKFSKAFDLNQRITIQKAGALFGQDNAGSAIIALSALMAREDDKKALFKTFRKSPDIVGVLVQNDENVNPAQVMGDKRVFFQGVRRHLELTALLERVTKSIEDSSAHLEKFMQWRNHPKTATLLDWYESCEVLNDLEEPEKPARNVKPGAQPMPG